MADTERTFFEYLVYVSENRSPLDFMLVADHIDKFFYGALLTIEITVLALFIGGVVGIPPRIDGPFRPPLGKAPCFWVTFLFLGCVF